MSLPVHLWPDLASVEVGAEVQVTGDEAHHAVAVRRLSVGEAVRLVDGAGRVAQGTVAETGKRLLVLRVEQIEDLPEPRPEIIVVQALPKGERGELAVEMLTEVGVARIVPWAASRSVAVWRGERAVKSHARWASTAREAAKQSRRAWFPEVDPLATTGQVAEAIAAVDLALVLHEDASEPLSAVLPAEATRVPERILLVVGPEGGVSEEEVALFTQQGARAVRLGAEVLRTSTAGVAAVAALLARTPRWS